MCNITYHDTAHEHEEISLNSLHLLAVCCFLTLILQRNKYFTKSVQVELTVFKLLNRERYKAARKKYKVNFLSKNLFC